ncbi:MAG TPA: Gfo/Idh/MocA family oxidoreductase [Acidimicrobiales bacterium]|nr:Gfo/Idh/MocA family oxidoreductase [Acidimicrobiales bacterium]
MRVGIVGLGRATATILPSMLAHPEIEIVALAEPNDELREAFCEDFKVRGYADAEDLFVDPEVEIAYIATPHQFHKDHVLDAVAHEKHVLVEKPIALTLEECDAMILAADRAGVVFMVGHTNGYDPPVLALRDLAASQRYGALRMINTFNYSDFLYRPRRPEELDTKLGGGIMYNQFPHQVDMVRTITDSRVTFVSAVCGSWDKERPTEAAVAALLRFENGAVANIVYSGYAHLSNGALTGETKASPGKRESLRSQLINLTPEQETSAKAKSGYIDRRQQITGPLAKATEHERFGVLVAGFEGADVVTSPGGLTIYGDGFIEQIEVPFGSGGGRRATVFDELHAAVTGATVIHDGRWGRSTLSVCLAALKSSVSGREISPEP